MDAKKNREQEKWMKYLEWAFIFFLLFTFAYYIINDNYISADSSVTQFFNYGKKTEQWMNITSIAKTPADVIRYFFKHYGIELIIIFVTLTLSIISILGSIFLRLFYHKKIALEYLGWGILIAAVWNITNSDFRQVIFENPFVASNIISYMIILMPLPFLFFMNHIQKYRYQKLYCIAVLTINIEFILFSIMVLSGLEIHNYIIAFLLLIFVLSGVTMLATIPMDIHNGKIKDYPFVAVGMLCVWLVSLYKIAIIFINVNSDSDTLLPFGLILLLFVAAINTGREIIVMEKDRQLALSASEAKGRFLANMSHEIRTPINAVLGMDAMILRECSDATIKEYALDIQNAGQTLLSLINDILDLSKIESGKLEILPEEYDFSSLIHDIMNMITMKAKDKELKVNLSIDEKLPSRLYGDDVRIRQILVNLMNNAVKYTEKGSVTLTVKQAEIDNNADSPDESKGSKIVLFFQVEDTGIGIKDEDISKLFAEFERIEEGRNRNIEGTGLGMSITTQLLEMMDSKLQVTSVYGKGSKFFFTLGQEIVNAEPIGNLEERIQKQAEDYTYEATFTAPDAQIMVVDDNSVNRRVFANLLKETKIQIEEAAGGFECIKKASQKHYDLIFLDHMMPDLNGIDTLQKMRHDNNCKCMDTPVIALTANAISGAKEMYLSHGFDSFLSKPIIPEKLEKMLSLMLPEDKVIYEKSSTKNSVNDGKNAGTKNLPDNDSKEKLLSDELPQIDGIDWDFALLHMSNREILADTLKNFYQNMDTDAIELVGFFNSLNGDKEQIKNALYQYEVKIHSIKSNAAMIGAIQLSGVAKMLEYAAKDGNTKTIFAITPAFLDEWQKMYERLSPYFINNNDTEKDMVDFEWLSKNLDLIIDAMNDMDIDTADETVGKMQDFSYPESVTPLIEKLNLSVANIDTEQTQEIINEIKKNISKTEVN